MKNLRWLGILCCLLAVAACETESDKQAADKMKEEKAEEAAAAKAEKLLPICPQVAIVRDLDAVADYGGQKPAPEQFVAGAKMQNIDGNCSYKDEGVDITFDLSLVATRGPHNENRHINFPYFVAVVDPSGNVLNKDSMTAKFDFASDSRGSLNSESLHVFIPLVKDKRASGPAYQVLAGFQLSKEQLDEVRKP